MKSTRNWSDAPPEISGLIAERLASIEDCASFRGVCTSWRSAVFNDVSSKTFPWIMFPQYSSQGEQNQNFWSLTRDKFYKLTLPDATNRVLSGSAYGWLVLSRGQNVEIFNPLTRMCLPLPPLSTLEGYTSNGNYFSFDKSVLLTSAGKDGFLVFVVFSDKGKLACSRPGDSSWKALNVPLTSYDDVLHLDNQFYAIDTNGLVKQFGITGGSPVGGEFALPSADIEVEEGDERTFYLVEISGELYMVLKFKLQIIEYRSKHFFKVFKLDQRTRKWEEMFTLGDYAIFVGFTTSFSIPVSNHPEARSSVYFMDRFFAHRRGSRNMGRFNLETMDLVALDPDYYIVNFSTTPFWFVPSLC